MGAGRLFVVVAVVKPQIDAVAVAILVAVVIQHLVAVHLVGVFVFAWLVSAIIYRLKRYDEIEAVAP